MVAFNPIKDIPDLAGKVFLVTGANSGLGEATVTAIAQHNPGKIYLAARSQKRAEESLARIKATSEAASTANIEILDLDLSSFESVTKAAAHINKSSDRLDVAVLNGGIASIPNAVSKDGYEITWATNYLGHVLLTQLLMPKLLATTKLPGADVRVVVLSSIAHKRFVEAKNPVDLDVVKTDGKAMSGMYLYGQANLARTLFAYKLAKQYPGITSTSVHPGLVRSNIWGGEKTLNVVLNTLLKPLVYFTGVTAEEGAKTQLWCSFSKDATNGAYYEPVGVRADGKFSRDEALAEKVWDWTEKELASHGGPGWAKL